MLVVAATMGCGDDDDDGAAVPKATVAPTSTAVPTATPIAVPTATPEEDDHREIEIGSTEEGAGELAAEFDLERPITLFFDTCIGGEGDECSGGTLLYSAPNPGFVPHGHDHEAVEIAGGHVHEVFELVEGTPVGIEVIAIAEGLSMMIEGERLDAVGQTAVLGEAPDFHGDAETFYAWASDSAVGEDDIHLSFRLTSGSASYEDSDEYELHFALSDDDHEQDDDPEHE